MKNEKNTPSALRVKVKSTTTGWQGRVNNVEGNLTQVEWLKDENGLYTEITSWVLSADLIQIN